MPTADTGASILQMQTNLNHPLAPVISTRRLPQTTPDQPPVDYSPRSSDELTGAFCQSTFTSTPQNSGHANFDVLLDRALNDLRRVVLAAHKKDFVHKAVHITPILDQRVCQTSNASEAARFVQQERRENNDENGTSQEGDSPENVVGKRSTDPSQPSTAMASPVPAKPITNNGSLLTELRARASASASSRRGSEVLSKLAAIDSTHRESRPSLSFISATVNDVKEAVANRKLHRMRSALKDRAVMVNRHLLKQRLSLENNLVHGTWRFLRWVLCFIPFVWAAQTFEPGMDIGSVHDMLIEHYGLDKGSLLRLKEWDHVYGFFRTFTEQNNLLDPTGVIYWCDPRYLETLGVTSVGGEHLQTQEALRTLAGYQNISLISTARRLDAETDHSQESAGGGSRRLQASPSAPSSSSSSLESILRSLKVPRQNPTELGEDPHGHKRLLYDCQIPQFLALRDLHIKLEQARLANSTEPSRRRRRSDGYGPLDDYKTYFQSEFNYTYPWVGSDMRALNATYPSTGTYLTRFHYPYSSISLARPVIYQTRYSLRVCKADTFADHYLKQGYNILSPEFGRNAPRAVDLIECIDRSNYVHDETARDIDTKRYSLFGEDVYARMAAEPGDTSAPDFTPWQRIGWLGKQTKTASISVLIYIDGLETFTSVSVHFTQEPGGAISVRRKLATIVELNDKGTEWKLHLAAVLGLFFGLMCVIYDLSNCRRLQMEQRMIDHSCLFEVFSRMCFLVFIIVLEVSQMNRETMKDLFDDALNTFLNRPDFSETGEQPTLQHFFEVKEHVTAQENKHVLIKIMGTIVYASQMIQLILLLGAHPRVDLLCATLVKSINGLCHYLLVFFLIFLLLAYYAHWMFASSLPSMFDTFSHSIMKQAEMLVGYADDWPWEEMRLMNSTEQFIWISYLMAYWSVAFLILLNFFIAIILEGFFSVSRSLTEENVGGSGHWAFVDVWQSWRGVCIHRSRKWPPRIDIIARIDNFEEEQKEQRERQKTESVSSHSPCVTSAILCQDYGFEDEESALEFLCAYALKAPTILDVKPHESQNHDQNLKRGSERTEVQVTPTLFKMPSLREE